MRLMWACGGQCALRVNNVSPKKCRCDNINRQQPLHNITTLASSTISLSFSHFHLLQSILRSSTLRANRPLAYRRVRAFYRVSAIPSAFLPFVTPRPPTTSNLPCPRRCPLPASSQWKTELRLLRLFYFPQLMPHYLF
jgi:hypothetical protein